MTKLGIERRFTRPTEQWVQIHNEWARDERLDWAALGILTYLHSHSDGWIVKMADLGGARGEKRHRVEQAIAQLEQFGYVKREVVRNERGYRLGTRWLLFDPRPNADHQH